MMMLSKKLAHDASNSMSSFKDMQAQFPKLHKQWTISHLSNQTRLTGHLHSEKDEFSAIQEIIMLESKKYNHLFEIKLMSPALMHVEPDSEIEDEISLKQTDFTTGYDANVKSTSVFLDCVVRAEKNSMCAHQRKSMLLQCGF